MVLPIYVSGPHGSGKTTMINKILASRNDFLESDFDINFLKQFPSMSVMNAFERCTVRLYHRIYTALYANQYCLDINKISKNNPTKAVLVSRSIYDSLVYSRTEYLLGQMTDEEYSILNSICENALRTINCHVIILNPPTDIIISHLDKRRKFNERTEREVLCAREDTYEYVSLVHNEFSKLRNYDNVLYLTDNEEGSIEKVFDWIVDIMNNM